MFCDDLPKTRSGKIMRRLLENISNDEELGNTTTLRSEASQRDPRPGAAELGYYGSRFTTCSRGVKTPSLRSNR